MARTVKLLVWLAIIGAAAFFGWRHYQHLVETQPERFPWTPLDLADPIGPFTDDKLAALAQDPARCTSLLGALDLGDRPGDPVFPDEAACAFPDPIRLGDDRADFGELVTACPVAAALAVWEREIVQPAAMTHLGSDVVGISQLGSYVCRRMYGAAHASWSRHATGDAVDIAGFTLADGRTVSLLADWNGNEEERAFLRAVRDGACDLFSVTLSPDYNAAHADHLHLAMRDGTASWSACR